MENQLREFRIVGHTVDFKTNYREYVQKHAWKVCIPSDVFKRLNDNLEKAVPSGFKFHKNTALYLLGQISSVKSWRKDQEYYKGYVNLSSKYLKSIDYNYKNYINYFEEIGIIEVNNKYSNGDSPFTKSYRYKYDFQHEIRFEIVDVIGLKKGPQDAVNKLFSTDVKDLRYLTKWFNSKLTIDEGVLDTIEAKLNSPHSKKRSLQENLNKFQSYINSYTNLSSGQYWASRDSKTDNRLHTNLTNMPKFFRPSMSYDGKRLASVDIKNSQPYFAALLCKRICKIASMNDLLSIKEGNEYVEVDKESEIERKNKEIDKVIEGNMLLKTLEISCSKGLQREVDELLDWAIKGVFYEKLIPLFEYEQGEDKYLYSFYSKDKGFTEKVEFDSKRDLVKRLTLYFLYKSNTDQSNSNYMKFKERFPEFSALLEKIKEKDPKKLPKVLQHIEADCVLDYVCKSIAELYPNMPLWTIHDSVISTVDNIELLEKLVRERIAEYCDGYLPQLEVERW